MIREEKNEFSKQRIIKAAIEEFGNNDYSTASTNSICKNHGISKGLLFYHFKNKDSIFISCIDKCIKDLVEYINKNYIMSSNNIDINLNSYFIVRYEFFRINPYYSKIFRNATTNAPKHLLDNIEEIKYPLKELNKNILKDMLKNQTLKDGISQDNIIKLILSFSDYLIINQHEVDNESTDKQVIDFIKMLFYGVID